jgi:hypothetical protein
LTGFKSAGSAEVYYCSEANLQAIARSSDFAVSAAGFQATYPANSITLVAIPKAGA